MQSLINPENWCLVCSWAVILQAAMVNIGPVQLTLEEQRPQQWFTLVHDAEQLVS